MPYLTPDEIPEGTACRPLFIPNSTEWLAIVSGALTELTKSWNWEQFGSVTIPEALEVAQGIVATYYDGACNDCMTPGGNFVSRLGEFGAWQMLEGGAWVAPTGDYALPAYTAREEPTADERKCLAAKNATKVLEQFYEDLSDAFELGTTIAEAVLGFGVAIGIAIAPPLGLLAAAVLEIGLIFFAELFAALEFITADYWTTNFNNAIVCTLLENATDTAGVVTFDFDQVWQDIQLKTFGIGLDANEILLSGQILYLLSVIGAEGLNLAGETTSITDSDCEVCEPVAEWCYVWADATELLAEGFVHNYHNGISEFWSGSTLMVLTHVEFGWTWNGLGGGSGGTGNGTTIFANGGDFTDIVFQEIPLDDAANPAVWIEPAGYNFNGIAWGLNAEGGSDGLVDSTYLKLKGLGENPGFTHGTECEP